MGDSTCYYTDWYLDTRTGTYCDYTCGRPSQPSGLCKFHDENYFQNNQNEVRALLLNELTSLHRSTLFLIGCHIPTMEVNRLHFREPVYFVNTKFHGDISFSDVQFSSVNFSFAKFFKNLNFHNTEISDFFDFSDVKFDSLETSNIVFENSTLNGKCKFTRTVFPAIKFNTCDFNYTNFRSAKFEHNMLISKCAFHSEADFTDCSFLKESKFLFTSFHSNTLFQYANFNNIVKFHNVDFKESQLVTFNGNLSNVSFLGSDITRVKFDEKIVWGDSDRYSVFDARELIKTPEKFGLSSVLAVYRNLRENYEFHLMYEEAGQFFIKEMDLKRNYFEDEKNDYKTKLKPIYKRLVSLTSFYSYLSRYGESFSRPLFWSCLIISVASLYFWFNPDLNSIQENYSLNSVQAASDLLQDSQIRLKVTIERTLSSFFQIDSKDLADFLVRITSIPVLGTLFIVLRRRFERRFRH